MKPKKLVVAERFRFHNRKQRDSYTLSQFEAVLRGLASRCDFGEFFGQVKKKTAQVLQIAIAHKIADSEAKALHK